MKMLSPFGVLLNNHIDGNELRSSVLENGLVIIRGHDIRTQNDFLMYAKTLGECLEWEFGAINELKVDKEKKNYLYTHQNVPFHWDGAFKMSPSFLLFHCLQAPRQDAGGETLFTHTGQLYNALNHADKDGFQSIKLNYQTDTVVHYGGNITTTMVSKHPHTKKTILRYAEPVDTEYNPVSLSISGLKEEGETSFIEKMKGLIYDNRFCYQHQWRKNDLVIVDNHALIHARHAFKQDTQRHIRRIQII